MICAGCGIEIAGRSDRRWCSDRCRKLDALSRRFWGGYVRAGVRARNRTRIAYSAPGTGLAED